jgi:PAS domain S-box-containing protein
MEKEIRILLVDDDEIDLEVFQRYVSKAGLAYAVETAASEEKALDTLERDTFDVVLLDYNLGPTTGIDLLPHIGTTPVIFVTGGGSEEIAAQAMRHGCYDYLIKDPDYNYLKVLPITIRNVLEHRKAEIALRENEERFRALTEKADDLVMILDHQYTYTYVSPSVRLLEYSPAEVLGKNPHYFVHPMDIPLLEESLGESIHRPYEAVKMQEVRIRRKNGSWALLEGLLTSMLDQPGIQGIVFNGRDITERKQAEEALKKAHDLLEIRVEERTKELKYTNEKLMQEISERKKSEEALRKSEERLNKFLDSATEAFFLLDADLNFTDVNQRGLELLRMQGNKHLLLGKNITEVMPDTRECGIYERYREVMHRGQPYIIEDYTLPSEYGELKGVLKVFKVGDSLGMILIDTTRSKRLEAKLRQAQKMEALGSLAGGIAHDFNNILGIIMGYAELISDDIQGNSRAWGNLQQVLSAANRGKEMIKQIMAFSKINEKKYEAVNLQDLVKEVLMLLESTLPDSIQVRIYNQERVGHIHADSTQIHQVLVNICTNAIHAMKEQGGTLDVYLKEENLDPAAIGSRDLERGAYAHLIVTDTGHGMTTDVQKRIFEPYFTTKKQGEGSGMGLAVAHGIVKGHGGEITVQSKPFKGTSFHIYLPVPNQEAVHYGRENPGNKENELKTILPPEEAFLSKANILFAYEEDDLLTKAKLLLEYLGYQVVTKTSTAEALEAVRTDPTTFHLVITDQTMADMSGERLAFEIKCLKPQIKIILCTGLGENIDEDYFKANGISALVRKPIILRDMAAIVKEVLTESERSGY